MYIYSLQNMRGEMCSSTIAPAPQKLVCWWDAVALQNRLESIILFFSLIPPRLQSQHFPTFLCASSACTRWVNLWWPVDIPDDTGSGRCAFSTGVGEIGASVFVGNAVLVVGILLGTFLLHVAIVSGVEAYWLAEVSFVSVLSARFEL